MTSISIIIPTCGRPAKLRRTLAHLAAQQTDVEFEVLVVCDGGPVFTESEVPRHPNCTDLRVLRLPEPQGISVARNLGADHARHPILGFLDDDTYPAFDWIFCLDRILGSQPELVGVVGKIDPVTTDHPLDRLRQLGYDSRHLRNLERTNSQQLVNRFRRQMLPGIHQVDYLSGGNCGVRADAFAAIDGFDPRYRVMQDRELAARLLKNGGALAYEPAMVVRHDNNATLRHLTRGRYRGGKYAVELARDHPEAFNEGRRLQRFSTQYGEGPVRMAVRRGTIVTALAALSLASYSAGVASVTLRENGRLPEPDGGRRPASPGDLDGGWPAPRPGASERARELVP